jgi:hypothetical protein
MGIDATILVIYIVATVVSFVVAGMMMKKG